MFNFFLKSAFYYTIVNKYGKKILIILSNIIFIIFIQFIYSDIIEILMLNNLKDYTIYALLAKWLLILLNILFIVIIVKSIIQNKKVIPSKSNKTINQSKTSFEEDILNKDTLTTKSDLLMEELLSKK